MPPTASKDAPGVAVFLTPCLLLAATVATALRQLGWHAAGLPFAIALYIVFDFLLFRLQRKSPGLQRLRQSFSLSLDTPLAATATSIIDEAAKPAKSRPSGPAVSGRRSQVVATPTAQAGAAAAAAPAAQSQGLRLSMLGTDIFVNSETPFEFQNDFFKGRMLFLLNGTPPDPKWGAHFEGKGRAFEMQIQGNLKSLPKGEVYMGGELSERPKHGLVTQAVSKVVMSFAKQVVKSLHYSFGDRRPPSDPLEAESPHVTFPLYRVMDWFVVTPKAEAPPPLGGDLNESLEDQAARRGGKSPDIVWRTDVTYTMCFHSNTVNFQDWTVMNVPGQGTLDLNTFLCKQPVSVVVYDFTAASASAAHKARDKSYMFQCTISNDSPGDVACAAPVAKRWAAPAAALSGRAAAMSVATPVAAGEAVGVAWTGGDIPEREDSEDGVMANYREAQDNSPAAAGSSDEEADRDGRVLSALPFSLASTANGPLASSWNTRQLSSASTIASPRKEIAPSFASPDKKETHGKGLVKSGDILPLLMGGDDLETSQSDGYDQAVSVAFLGEGNGGASVTMRRGNAMPAGVQVVKVGGGVVSFRSDYLYDGDAIVLHHPESRKFVRIGRAWALGWSSKASASKIHFVIRGIEPGRALARGQSFSLSSRRWPDWEVGVARQPSNKLGGKALGCINQGKRRNTTRYTLLALVARPWFDPAADLNEGNAGGVIPALEAEADAISIPVRGPFEDFASAEEEEDDEDDGEGSDLPRTNHEDSDVDEGMTESDPEYESDLDKTEVERGIKPQPSFAGDGISNKAARAMACYPDNVSSLKVGIPAWVEFLHRGRRQGQLAFVVAVHAAPSAPPSPTMKPAGEPKSFAAADSVDDSAASQSRATPAQAWTCLRTGKELTGVVMAYRECVRASVATGDWQSKPRPRVIRHMGTADQSVRLMSHEVSEIQRWEASSRIREGGAGTPGSPSAAVATTPESNKPSAVNGTGSSSAPGGARGRAQRGSTVARGSGLEATGLSSEAEGMSLSGDGEVSSPPQIQRSPRPAGFRTHSEPPSRTRGARYSLESSTPAGGTPGDVPRDNRAASAVPMAYDACKGGSGSGEGLTAPYRLLCKTVTSPGELDRHFLSGSSASDLGVVVGAATISPILGSAVARCLWESHWREEWAALFPSHVACYPPLSKKPAWVLPLKALHKVSSVSDERCPFPGLRCLRLETIGRAHYLCFSSRISRDMWLQEISRLSKAGVVDPPSGLELGQDPREMYVLKTTQWRLPPRLVLNSRRPGFDLPDGMSKQDSRAEGSSGGIGSPGGKAADQSQQQRPWELSAEVLRAAFRVHADPGNKRLVPFLDLASSFRHVDVSALDLESEEALCFFANLYHLLVRHMLIVLGPPSSAKEWPSSYVQVSYEVGGDVFSLQELEHCVLRGRLQRPSLKDLPKRFAPLPPEGDDHYVYSLGKADSRMSLFLNNGSQSNPSIVVLLSPGMADEQINQACQAFVDHTVKTDAKRKQIRVHKAFQMYAKDLQPRATSKDMVRYGLRFAGHAVMNDMSALDVDISQAHIRYHQYLLKCHETMTLLDLSGAAIDDSLHTSQRGS